MTRRLNNNAAKIFCLFSSIFRILLILQVIPRQCSIICYGFSTRASSSTTSISSSTSNNGNNKNTDNNILILDHINMNHEKGRHDWLKSFYGNSNEIDVGFLQCVFDPRKLENLQLGRKTLWANIGSNQFHLSKGSPDAQILDGCIKIVYPSLDVLKERYNNIMNNNNNNQNNCLKESKFQMIIIEESDEAALMVTDPWGTNFRIVEEDKRIERDNRRSQPGGQSEGIGISDLTIHVPMNCNLDGIGRFYRDILGAELVDDEDDDAHQENDKKMKMVQIRMRPFQILTFVPKEFVEVDTHVDLREIKEDRQGEKSSSTTVGNYGIHISIYVADLPSCYQRANEIGVTYVNTRFSRQAYTIDDAIDQCMFRCLDIIDPLNVEDGPILKLEHEIRSVIKRDGTKYKSCPFDTIPDGCITLYHVVNRKSYIDKRPMIPWRYKLLHCLLLLS